MKIQSKAPLLEPRKALASGGPAPAKSPGAAPAETSGVTARKAGFSQDSEFSRKTPDVASTFRRGLLLVSGIVHHMHGKVCSCVM